MNFLLHAIPFDARLVTDYPQIVNLADALFPEINELAQLTNDYRSKEALKIILINLLLAFRHGVACRYSRDRNTYTADERYGMLFFKYDRIIPIVDSLVTLFYIEQKDGINFPEIQLQSRMWATQKLIKLFHENSFYEISTLKPQPLKELIQIRSPRKEGGTLLKYNDTPSTEIMREHLKRYNEFIQNQLISCHLDRSTEVSVKFLMTRKGNILTGRITITDIHTNGETTVRLTDGTHYTGLKLDSNSYFLSNNPELLHEEEPQISKYFHITTPSQYYIRYINSKLSNTTTTTNNSIPSTPTITNTNIHTNTTIIPMTQRKIEIYKQYQLSDLKIPTTIDEHLIKRPLSEYGIHRLEFTLNQECLHRVFCEFPDNGGRFYGAVHIDLPKEVRRHIRINGAPCVELDFGAHHIRLLYNYYRKIPYEHEDPYSDLCREHPEERSIYKKILLIAINTEDEPTSIKAIRKELYDTGIRGHYLKDDFIKDALDRFKAHHAPIAPFLSRAMGLKLQYLDSQIAELVLLRMMRLGIPCLPVHDSFIAPAEHEETLRQMMITAYKDIANGFEPSIGIA